jgi:hypothetical protein
MTALNAATRNRLVKSLALLASPTALVDVARDVRRSGESPRRPSGVGTKVRSGPARLPGDFDKATIHPDEIADRVLGKTVG